MEFTMGFGKGGRGRARPDDDRPFRLLVLADLGGHGETAGSVPLAARQPIAVDIDNLDAVFARLAPRLALNLDGAPLTIAFAEREDFHPDRLFRLAPFAALRQLRGELQDARQFARAAAALGAAVAPSGSETKATDDGGISDIERLLGSKPTASTATPARPGTTAGGAFDLDRWLRGIVAPHVVPDHSGLERQLVAAVDAAIAEQMRRLLHHPSFQALEATWLGIDRLVRNIESGGNLQLFVMDVTAAELRADLHDAADPGCLALYRCLCGPATEPPDGAPWSLLVVDHAFAATAADLRLLGDLGRLAARAGAPLLAAATPQLLGSNGIAQLADPHAWQPLDAELAASWTALRRGDSAASIGLALPRLLARLPYGQQSDPISAFAFEEMAGVPDHDDYLWSNPAFALALLLAQSFQDEGWRMDPDDRLDIVDLPAHIVRADGETRQQPCAELLAGETAGQAMLEGGLMPLVSHRDRPAARLLRWQSIADPARPLQGAWAAAA